MRSREDRFFDEIIGYEHIKRLFGLALTSHEDRIGAEQQAQAEARRLQQIEAEGRQLLERTVAEYLAFVQHVAQGDLTQRLPVSLAQSATAAGEQGASQDCYPD